MRKFNVLIGSSIAREVNANEYSVWPKTNHFTAADGHEAAFTSGKGKSAVNNHYIYFKHEGVIYYFKSHAGEVKDAQAHFEIGAGSTPTVTETPAAEPAPAQAEPPKARRQRAKA